uniref:Granulins domain-containing protein n=1 Tax=Amphilophus citrinellus TaxID=61819 RepID=A0A3Q0RHW2_AMPCI
TLMITMCHYFESLFRIRCLLAALTCPDGRHSCPNKFTCCPLITGEYGCCPFPQVCQISASSV